MKILLIKSHLLWRCCIDEEQNIFISIFYFLLNILSRIIDLRFGHITLVSLFLLKKNRFYPSYTQWCLYTEKDNKEYIKSSLNPLISVIIPLYNPNIEYFKLCINSVLNQKYTNWEICLADDNSKTSTQHIEYIEKLSKDNSSIKFIRRSKNGHISECSNSALSLSSGSYILLLDQDDLLAPNCLQEFIRELEVRPNLEILYADEDLIEDNVRHSPAFKPGFSPHSLISRNYITHPLLIKKSIIKSIRGFRIGLEGSQDHDLLLRSIKVARNITHIPKVLYHWRSHKNSTSQSILAKPYIVNASFLAIKEHLNEPDLFVFSANFKYPNYYRFLKPSYCPSINVVEIGKNGEIKNGEDLYKLILETKEEFILFKGEDVSLPSLDSIKEASYIIKSTGAISVGGAITYRNRLLPCIFYLQDNFFESYSSYKKMPFVGYHGLGLVMSNVDGLNPNLWLVDKEFLRKKMEIYNGSDFYEATLSIFSSCLGTNEYNVFLPSFIGKCGKLGKAEAEEVYNIFRSKKHLPSKSNFLSRNIKLTKTSYSYSVSRYE